MRNLRLIFTFWLASFVMPGISFALGLGEIDVSSFLNQPLKAEIEVISARPGEIDDLLVSLASRDSFARAGLSRPNHLSDLRFSVRKNEAGDKATILVSTKNAIKEPFLNFLVEADWSKGRVLREFTVLLDPPFYADSAVPTTSSSQQATSNQIAETNSSADNSNQVSGSVIASTTEEPIATTSGTSLTESNNTELSNTDVSTNTGGSVVVEKGDALWSIASQFKDSGHSMGQVMLAMQRANPEAFGNDNINNLKVGAVLRAPTADEMDQLSKQEAYARVLEQNGLWDDYVARVTGTAVSVASGDGGSTGGEGDQSANGDLSLLTPGDGDSDSTGQGENADVNSLKTQLALAEEQLDASRVENQDMQSRIADLEARLSKFDELQKMVEIEDDSLAQLQADQTEEEIVQPELTTIETTEEIEELAPAPESLEEELQSADADALLDEILSEGTEASSGEAIDDEVSEDTITETVEETVVAPPAPVIVTETGRKEPSIFDGILPPGVIELIPSMSGILNDPIALGGIVGIVVLLLGLILYKRRKSNEDDDEDDTGITVSDVDTAEMSDLEEDLTPVHLAESTIEADNDTNINIDLLEQSSSDDEEDEFSKTAIISQADMPEPESKADSAPSEQDDVLNEIDVYLAYGLYDNAEELLKQSLDTNPDRADYRSKLLDTYFATKNASEFSKEAELLKSMGSAGAKYWDKVQVMGYELAPDNALFSAGKDSNLSPADLEISKPEMADFDLGASEDDTNFSTTDFNLGEDDSEFTATQAVAETQEIPEIANLADLGGSEEEVDDDLPDELGALEFTLDSDTEEENDVDDISEINFDGPEDQDLGIENDDLEDVSLDFDMDDDSLDSADGSDFDLGSAEADLEATAIIDVPSDDADLEELSESTKTEEELESTSEFDLGMEDTAITPARKDDVDDSIELDIDVDSPDQKVDMDVTDFGEEDSSDDLADDFSLDLGEEDSSLDDESLEVDDISLDIEDSLSNDLDLSSDIDESRTGTFAPGDFDDPDETIIPDEVDIDDIGDLMLPDDVDEVSTKLDLARAFIDMGDAEGARGSLDEVLAEGSDEQKAEATQLLDKI